MSSNSILKNRLVVLNLTLMLTLAGAGCGKSTGPQPVKVTGTVTRGGRPIESLLVFFEPKKGQQSVGKTDSAGKFKLALGSNQFGAVPGDYTVYFQFTGKTPADELAYQEGTLQLTDDLKVATTTYGSAEKSPLKVEVKTKDPQDIAITLE